MFVFENVFLEMNIGSFENRFLNLKWLKIYVKWFSFEFYYLPLHSAWRNSVIKIKVFILWSVILVYDVFNVPCLPNLI